MHWTHSHYCGRDSHVYSRYIHTAVGEMDVSTLDTFTLLWERQLCIQWTHSHCCGRGRCVYSEHIHTAVGEIGVYAVDTFTLLWERWTIIWLTL